MRKICTFVFLITTLGYYSCNPSNNVDSEFLFIGTYTKKEGHVDGKAQGIEVYSYQPENGKLTEKIGTIPSVNPSYIVIHPSGKYLYAANEIANSNPEPSGTLSAFIIDPYSKKFVLVNTVSSHGHAPCYVSIDNEGKYLLTANYVGTVSVHPILADGSLGKATDVRKHKGSVADSPRQEAAHPHMIKMLPGTNMVYVADLGMNTLVGYKLENGKLDSVSMIEMGEKAGPRHFAFHPDNGAIYILNELIPTIEVCYIDEEGHAPQVKQVVSTQMSPGSGEAIFSSAIHVHPSGKFLYSANRGLGEKDLQTISVFQINPTNYHLSLIQEVETSGRIPRDFTIDPAGRFLLVGHQDSDTIETFEIDGNSGKLNPTGQMADVMTPVCLKFYPH